MFSGSVSFICLVLCVPGAAGKRKRPPEGGVVLWAYGRSATDVFAGSVVEAAKWKYCNGAKEGFKDHALTAKSLRKCMKREERFTHLKPQHLTREDSELRNSTEFFRAARQAGYTTVAAVYRDNALNRAVSSFELSQRLKCKHIQDTSCTLEFAREKFCGEEGALAREFRETKKLWEIGIEDAKHEGFDILQLRFTDVVDRVCDSVERLLALVPPLAVARGFRRCKPYQSPHVLTSHHELTMEGRVGPVAYECITRQLERDPDFSWMLQPHLETPPARHPQVPAHSTPTQ